MSSTPLSSKTCQAKSLGWGPRPSTSCTPKQNNMGHAFLSCWNNETIVLFWWATRICKTSGNFTKTIHTLVWPFLGMTRGCFSGLVVRQNFGNIYLVFKDIQPVKESPAVHKNKFCQPSNIYIYIYIRHADYNMPQAFRNGYKLQWFNITLQSHNDMVVRVSKRKKKLQSKQDKTTHAKDPCSLWSSREQNHAPR